MGQARTLISGQRRRETIPPLSKSAGMHNNRMQITKSPRFLTPFIFDDGFIERAKQRDRLYRFLPYSAAKLAEHRKENNAKARQRIRAGVTLFRVPFLLEPRFLEHGDSVPFHPPFRVILALPL